MPIVTVQVTREGSRPATIPSLPTKKAQLIKGVSQVLLDVLNKPPEATFVVIEEVDTENWGWGGLPVELYRKQPGQGRPEHRDASGDSGEAVFLEWTPGATGAGVGASCTPCHRSPSPLYSRCRLGHVFHFER